MSNPYIPPDDDGKLMWLINFNSWLQANGAAHGFTPAELAELATETTQFSGGMSGHQAAQLAARAATATKNGFRASAFGLARAFAMKLQAAPSATDADRAAAGVTVRDNIRTPGDPNAILAIPPPLLVLDFSVRRQVTIHWGPNPHNEKANGKPAGVLGCQIQFARGGISQNEASWIALEIDSESPQTHSVNETQPITIAYRARYVGKNLKFGPLGDPVVCTVSA